MSMLERIVLTECIIAIVLALVIIILAVYFQRRKLKLIKTRVMGGMYDPYGLYAPITEEEVALIDEQAKAYVKQQLEEAGYNCRGTLRQNKADPQ